MVIDTKRRLKEFEMAEKAGVKKELLETIKIVIQQYQGEMPDAFGPEELYFMFDQGLLQAGLKPNFDVKSIAMLCRAYMHGYAIGKTIKGG